MRGLERRGIHSLLDVKLEINMKIEDRYLIAPRDWGARVLRCT